MAFCEFIKKYEIQYVDGNTLDQTFLKISKNRFSDAERSVGGVLFNMAMAKGDELILDHSIDFIAKCAQVGSGSVKKAINKLEAIGWLVSQERKGNDESNAFGQDTSIRKFTEIAMDGILCLLAHGRKHGFNTQSFRELSEKIIPSFDENPVDKSGGKGVSGGSPVTTDNPEPSADRHDPQKVTPGLKFKIKRQKYKKQLIKNFEAVEKAWQRLQLGAAELIRRGMAARAERLKALKKQPDSKRGWEKRQQDGVFGSFADKVYTVPTGFRS